MNIYYTPSPLKQELAKEFYTLHEKGLTYIKIAKKYGYHKNYVMGLAHWYRDKFWKDK